MSLDSVVGEDNLIVFAGTHSVCLGFIYNQSCPFICAYHINAMEMLNHLILKIALGILFSPLHRGAN